MKKNSINQTALKIILVDENMGRSAILRRALQDKGHEVISRLEESENLANSNEITHADVVIVNADIPDEAVFANLRDVNKTKPKPIVMFTEASEEHMAGAAIKSGVNAYIVDGLEEKRVQPIIDVAIARFREFQALKDELDATRSQLAERKSIEKAKGLLMKHKKITEDEAYQSLRKMAMDKNKRISEVADGIISAFELLG
ncbi:ANTAR domain-containing response regulator [Pseudothioglobus sp. nBUS_23]|jgi:response regulator NasT|uniref:ANTAR domain-containing response regulator n=1 Tax=Pseudothioglobus sp. nBUS_23 TaxID=3395318 RepID=UPI003EB92731|tara:strand:- start:506 stop:1108 length:603 start_codon:yes stop_codon:yes gene_type:complete